MYKQKEFEQYKLKCIINMSGMPFTIYRNKKNEFNEPLDELEEVAKIKGIFHTTTNYMEETNSDSGSHVSRKVYTPTILCLVDEESNKIKKDDVFFLNNKKYKINGKVDYLEQNFAFDISSEVIEHG